MSRIVITTCPLTTDKNKLFDLAVNDEQLIRSITEFSKKLEDDGEDIFDRNQNIIVAESGYYCAFWEKDLTLG